MEAKISSIENLYRSNDFSPVILADIKVLCKNKDELKFLIGILERTDIEKLMGKNLSDDGSKKENSLTNNNEPAVEFNTIGSLEI